MKNKKFFAIAVPVLIAALLMPKALEMTLACGHEETYTQTVRAATCAEAGQEDLICAECETVLESLSLETLEHTFTEYVVEKEPSANSNGVKIRVCTVCNMEERQEFECPHEETVVMTVRESTCDKEGCEIEVCTECDAVTENRVLETLPHEKVSTSVTKEATCYATGLETDTCDTCGMITEERVLEKLECPFGEWEYITYATPFENGERYKVCPVCNKRVSENYIVEMEENSIYIPGTGIQAKFAVTSFTQGAVDANDVIYTTKAYSVEDENNPFILGHWFKSLKNLHLTEIGQKIYVNVNGYIDTYEVLVSEYAVEERGLNWIGRSTGVNCWDTFSSSMPSNKFRNTGRIHSGVDRNEDVNDGRTLHMYTCYYRRGEPWQSKDGQRGRWIVLADMVEHTPVTYPAESSVESPAA